MKYKLECLLLETSVVGSELLFGVTAHGWKKEQDMT